MSEINHSTLPSIKKASLPVNYEAAKTALAECTRLDECKEWADKAAALASYAKQSEDEGMFNMATRIRARAVKRCGDLLKEIEVKHGQRSDLEHRVAALPMLETRKSAAEEAGMSEWQQKTALRVASITDEDFDKQVEADKPPTVTALAEQGTKKRSPVESLFNGRKPEEFKLAQKLVSLVEGIHRNLAAAIDQDWWADCFKHLQPHERDKIQCELEVIENLTDEIRSKTSD